MAGSRETIEAAAACKVDINKMIASLGSLDENGGESTVSAKYAEDFLDSFVGDGKAGNATFKDKLEECPLCMEEMVEPVLFPCLHITCRKDALAYLAQRESEGDEGDCPVCRQGPVEVNDLVYIKNEDPELSNSFAPDAALPKFVLLKSSFKPSTKLAALLRHLDSTRADDPTSKW